MRERIGFISAISFVLGGGIAAVFSGILILEKLFPAYAQPGSFSPGIFLLGFSLFVIFLLAGMLLGAVLWLLIMRNWYSRSELAPYFTQPDIGLLTPLLSWLFDRLHR